MLRSDFGSALVSGAQKSGALELVEYRKLPLITMIFEKTSKTFKKKVKLPEGGIEPQISE